jgi:hypothetical protein
MAKKKISGTASIVGRSDFIIDDRTDNGLIYCPVIDGQVKAHGLIPRSLSHYPPQMFAPPSDMQVIPRSEWDARINEQEERQSSLEHIRMTGDAGKPIPSLDQDGKGYCWAHSTTSATILVRAANNLPYVRLSAFAIACKIKGFQDQGGWCGESAKFLRETGCPSVALWPEKSMDRSNDRPEVWANAAKHKVTEDWVDLAQPTYSANLTVDQLATCLLLNIPCAVDYDEWGHSICALRWMRVEAGVYAPKIWNSWTDQWGDHGMGIINKRWTVDSAVALRATSASII